MYKLRLKITSICGNMRMASILVAHTACISDVPISSVMCLYKKELFLFAL